MHPPLAHGGRHLFLFIATSPGVTNSVLALALSDYHALGVNPTQISKEYFLLKKLTVLWREGQRYKQYNQLQSHAVVDVWMKRFGGTCEALRSSAGENQGDDTRNKPSVSLSKLWPSTHLHTFLKH